MKKLIFLYVLGCIFTLNTVQAESYSFEKNYFDGGYKEVNKALRESEEYYNRPIALPTEVPPIPFTHIFGRFSKGYGEANVQFEVTYLNEDLGQNHFDIRIAPVEYKVEFKGDRIKKTFKLKDGQDAIFSEIFGFHLLVFEKEGWQYILSLDKRVSEQVLPEKLVDIANSIQY